MDRSEQTNLHVLLMTFCVTCCVVDNVVLCWYLQISSTSLFFFDYKIQTECICVSIGSVVVLLFVHAH